MSDENQPKDRAEEVAARFLDSATVVTPFGRGRVVLDEVVGVVAALLREYAAEETRRAEQAEAERNHIRNRAAFYLLERDTLKAERDRLAERIQLLEDKVAYQAEQICRLKQR